MALPLSNIRVLELAGLAPGPFAGMVLADYGADVVRIDKIGTQFNPDVLARGKRSISVSVKSPAGISLIKTLLSPNNANKSLWRADILIDPFRPGVLERLGLDPIKLLELNPRLIICRLTGFKRTGEYAKMAGHDLNYLALSGVLSMLGRKSEKPFPPANILADFGGGGIMAVVGILLALFERTQSGKGQNVEVDMITGTRYLSTFPLILARPSLGLGLFDHPRGDNILDSGSPWYEVYETRDGCYMTVAAIEPQFYEIFLEILLASVPKSIIPIPIPTPANQLNREDWPILFKFFTIAFKTKSRDEWTKIYIGSDACVAPILNRNEVDSEGVSSGNDLVEDDEGGIPSVAPTLTRTPGKGIKDYYKDGQGYFLSPGSNTTEILVEAGLRKEMVKELLKDGIIESNEEERESKL